MGGHLWIAGLYTCLIVIMMVFLIVLAVVSDNAKYQVSWIPNVTATVLDIMKVLVGAVVGALTPAAVGRFSRSRG